MRSISSVRKECPILGMPIHSSKHSTNNFRTISSVMTITIAITTPIINNTNFINPTYFTTNAIF